MQNCIVKIYIKWWLSLTIPAKSWNSVCFLSNLVLLQFILLFKAMLLASPVNLNILLVIFGVALIALVTVNCREDKRIAVWNNLTESKEKSTCINSLEINEIFSFHYAFDMCEKNTCVNMRGMNAVFDIL